MSEVVRMRPGSVVTESETSDVIGRLTKGMEKMNGKSPTGVVGLIKTILYSIYSRKEESFTRLSTPRMNRIFGFNYRKSRDGTERVKDGGKESEWSL